MVSDEILQCLFPGNKVGAEHIVHGADLGFDAAGLGIRQGLLTQICYLIAFIATSIFAPHVAAPIGLFFTDNAMLAFVIGFGIVLLGAAILVWLISPILKKLLIWDVLRKINSTLGAIVAVISTVLILSLICTTANTANLGEADTTKIAELVANCETKAEAEHKLEMVFRRMPLCATTSSLAL